MTAVPLVVEFAAPSSLVREVDRVSQLPIAGNGPPGTFVLLPGVRVSLPTDQIVCSEVTDDRARIGFGGMRFVGVDEGFLVFRRAAEVWPEDQLSPARSHTMRLDSRWVTSVVVDGAVAWRAATSGG